MAKVLITGAESFVGTNYLKYSQNKEVDEISLIDNQPEEIDFRSYDVILHLVAIVHQLKTISEEDYFKVNKDLCLRTAAEAKKAEVKQFVFLSTVKVYGEFNPESGPWTESSECYPEDPYGRSKYEAETELRKLEDIDFAVSIVRTPLVYGKDVRANMLSIMKLVDRIRILPFGNINNKRSFTYAKNLIGFIDRIIEKSASGVFIAMDSKPLSTTKLVKLIAKYLDKKIILFSLPKSLKNLGKKIIPRIFDRLYGSFEMENSQTLKQLDFVPQYTNEEGIQEMVTAYLEKKNKKKE